MKARALVTLAVAALSLGAAAQVLSTKPHLVTSAPVEPVRMQRGKSAPVQFLFRVNPGLHINSNTPTSRLLVPTRLDLTLPAGLKFARLNYPPGHTFTVSFSDEKLNVYTGDFEVDGRLAAERTLKPGAYQVSGVLQYQACNDRQCFPARKLPVSFQVTVR